MTWSRVRAEPDARPDADGHLNVWGRPLPGFRATVLTFTFAYRVPTDATATSDWTRRLPACQRGRDLESSGRRVRGAGRPARTNPRILIWRSVDVCVRCPRRRAERTGGADEHMGRSSDHGGYFTFGPAHGRAASSAHDPCLVHVSPTLHGRRQTHTGRRHFCSVNAYRCLEVRTYKVSFAIAGVAATRSFSFGFWATTLGASPPAWRTVMAPSSRDVK